MLAEKFPESFVGRKLTIELDAKLEQDLQAVRDRYAHQLPHQATPADILRLLTKIALTQRLAGSGVWKKSEGKCQFISPITQKKCESKHRLQKDHIKPRSKGGTSDPDNLQLLCATHNQWKGARLL